MAQRQGFMIYLDWRDSLMALTGEDLQQILAAMLDYTATGQEPHFSDRMAALWSMYRSRLDRDAQRYERAVQQRQEAVNKRWERKRAENSAAAGRQSAADDADSMNKYLNW